MSDVYKIGISIALANGVSAVLGVIQKDILGLKKSVDMTTGSLNRMKIAVGGMALVGIGGGILAGMNKLEKAGEAFTKQLELMKAAGFDAREQFDAINAAGRAASAVPNTIRSENLQAIRELRGALNSAGANPHEATEEAIKYLEIVQKANAVMKTAAGIRGTSHDPGGVYEMVKALEEIGATRNPERFERLLGGMVQASEAFGGKINARDWFQTLKYTRGAGQFYNDDFIAHYLPTLMQEMKAGTGSGAGGGPGAPLASLFQEVVGNVFGRNARKVGLDLGLIDPTKSTVDRHGRIHNAPGAWFGADEAATNPALWVQHRLIPALSKQMGGHMLDRDKDGQYVHVKEVSTYLATLFGNRTAQQMVGLLMQVQKMEGDKKLIQSAMELNAAYDEFASKHPELVAEQFHKQLGRIAEDLGAPLAELKTEMLYNFTKYLIQFAEVLERHPTAVKWLMVLATALGGLLVTLGTIAIAGAAISAIGGLAMAGTIAGIIALGAAIAYLATGNHAEQASRFFHAWGEVLARGWHRLLPKIPEIAKACLDFSIRFALEITKAMFRVGEAIGHTLRYFFDAYISDPIKNWAKVAIPAAAAAVTAELSNVTNAIVDWAKKIPERIVNALPAMPKMPSVPSVDPGGDFQFGTNPLVHKPAFTPPANSNRPINVHVHGEIEGRTLLHFVSHGIARQGSAPSRGTTGPDIRAGLFGGLGGVPT